MPASVRRGPSSAGPYVPLSLTAAPEACSYDAVVIAVAHNEFRAMSIEGIRALGKAEHVLYDLKYLFPADAADIRL